MKILIDIGHPAHVHYFKHFARKEIENGNNVLFTSRDKDVTILLLKHYGFPFINLGKNYKSKLGKIFGLFYFTLKLLLISSRYRPEIYINASIYSALVAWLLKKPHIALEDTFNMEQVKLYLPFTSCVLTGDYQHPILGSKEIIYSGYQELLYLHPKYFKPDIEIYKYLGLLPGNPYVIMRFVAWNASHDFGHKGISYQSKLKAIQEFEKFAKIFISAESELPDGLSRYQLKLPPHKLHDALAYATLVWAESFTIPAECSVLGVPSIIIHNTESYYLSEQEHKYNLCYRYTESEKDQQKAIDKGVELLKTDNKTEWQKRRKKMLADKIDVTAFLAWFVENYPDSAQIMRKDPNYQCRFK